VGSLWSGPASASRTEVGKSTCEAIISMYGLELVEKPDGKTKNQVIENKQFELGQARGKARIQKDEYNYETQ